MDSYPLRLPLLGANSSGDFRSTADYSAIFLNVMPFRSVVPEKTSGAWVCRPGAAARAVIQSKQRSQPQNRRNLLPASTHLPDKGPGTADESANC